ncbi:protein FLC EXPRESSOR-like isoform X1 [Tasmannia lanceolata]|uniref:protein FLC EXPRESSOR-like isoform X1 n=1 Tax=Tasmannia lanceolata TaxID=3420 RepID=UPI0040631A0A
MEGRNRIPPGHALIHPLLQNPRPHPLHLEERIAVQHRDIQALLLDNQRLAATHVALKQELAAAQHELRRASVSTADLKAERDARIRELYERSLAMEAEVRSLDSAAAELAQVRTDVQKLVGARQELTAQLQSVTADLARARAELQQGPAIKADIASMHQEIQRGRAAVEYEKKAHADNLEQSQAMEKNMISMAREVEKLRAELANAEKRARAAAAAAAAASPGPGYAGSYGNPEMGYGGSSYSDVYGMRQVQGPAEGGSQYGSVAASHGPYDMQQTYKSPVTLEANEAKTLSAIESGQKSQGKPPNRHTGPRPNVRGDRSQHWNGGFLFKHPNASSIPNSEREATRSLGL